MIKEKKEGVSAPQQKEMFNAVDSNNDQAFLSTFGDKKRHLKIYIPSRQVLFLQHILGNRSISKQITLLVEEWISKFQETHRSCLDCKNSVGKEDCIICEKKNKIIDLSNGDYECSGFEQYELLNTEDKK